MKKLLVLLSVGVLVFGMTACGNKDEQTPPSTEQTETQQTEATQTENTEATQGTVETATPETEGAAMDVTAGWSEDMTALRQVVVDTLGENYWPDTQIFPEILEGMYGITPDMYDDYMGEMPMMSANVDTLLIIKAKDDKVSAVEDALNAYRNMLVEDTMQYPQNLGKIQASRIQTYGNYVCFVQLGGEFLADDTRTEEESIILCQEQNELALEVIGKNLPK